VIVISCNILFSFQAIILQKDISRREECRKIKELVESTDAEVQKEFAEKIRMKFVVFCLSNKFESKSTQGQTPDEKDSAVPIDNTNKLDKDEKGSINATKTDTAGSPSSISTTTLTSAAPKIQLQLNEKVVIPTENISSNENDKSKTAASGRIPNEAVLKSQSHESENPIASKDKQAPAAKTQQEAEKDASNDTKKGAHSSSSEATPIPTKLSVPSPTNKIDSKPTTASAPAEATKTEQDSNTKEISLKSQLHESEDTAANSIKENAELTPLQTPNGIRSASETKDSSSGNPQTPSVIAASSDSTTSGVKKTESSSAIAIPNGPVFTPADESPFITPGTPNLATATVKRHGNASFRSSGDDINSSSGASDLKQSKKGQAGSSRFRLSDSLSS